MPLWGVADNDASEPKNLAEGEFQGTAGKRIFGVDNTEMGVVNGKSGDARKYAMINIIKNKLRAAGQRDPMVMAVDACEEKEEK